MPALIQIDRERLKRLPRPDAWDDQAALAAARTLGADVAVYGEVRRAGTDLSIVPRYVELKGERSERVRSTPSRWRTAPSWSGSAAFRSPMPAR